MRFCLVIDDPARPDWRQVDAAMALFGLTRREAQVGLQLAAGLTIGEASARLAISRNTARSHLAMLRDKLGVRSALAVAAEMRRAREAFLP
jgi:DNA-binding CsgD family transcriptional regulator